MDRTTTTDSSGLYTFTFLVGNYDVTASKRGYSTETIMGVSVTEGATTTQDFALTPQAVIETGPRLSLLRVSTLQLRIDPASALRLI